MDAAAASTARSDSKKAKVYEGSKDPKRAAFYEKISQRDMTPLWEVLKGLVTKEPKTACVPAIWHFDEVKPLVEEAGGRLTDFAGRPTIYEGSVLATNGRLHDQALALLREPG